MERFDEIIESAGKFIRRWWLLLGFGILLVAAGITVFCFPRESYMTLSVLFGVLMLVSGAVELIMALGSRNYFMMRGYSVVGGVLDLLLGIFLCCYPQVTLDLSSFRLPGAGWTMVGGVMMLVMGLLMVIMPLTVGVAAIALVTGSALIVSGLLTAALSLKLRRLHDNVHARYPGPDYSE